ncbi:ATP-dependent nuclease [Actinoplanes sp. NPDC020271]|uniref:ATP-dependent nuclease n=1 Tax=Actinoplanes sp. NPDC020271 TaxID=3363896 RepID=UPI0037965C85
MYVSELGIENLRACRQSLVRLRPDVTVLTGRNDTGKTIVLDALRQLTDPVDGHRGPALSQTDLTHDARPNAHIRLHAVLSDIQPEHAGTYRDALLPGADDTGTRRARWSLTYTPPPAGRRRGIITWHVGEGREAAGEPALRTAIRHVHLPAGRDAVRELSGPAGAARVRVMLEALLAEPGQLDAFLGRTALSMMDVSGDPAVRQVSAAVSRPLAAITAAADDRQAGLAAGGAGLHELSRILRMTSWPPGTTATAAVRSGHGYAHALYLATVLAELQTVREADLTLLLIDGPEAHLHPAVYTVLLNYLYEAAQISRRREQQDPAQPAGYLQVVVSTHAPALSAAVSTRDMVVMTRHQPQQVRAVAVADLGMADRAVQRLDRYLAVTRSPLLYGAPVLLVGSMAEALLVSAMADVVLAGSGSDREQARRDVSRFRAAAVVATDDVDVDLILTVLLTEIGGTRIGRRIAVLAGAFSGTPGEAQPSRWAARCSDMSSAGADYVRGFAAGEQLWHTLMCPANEPVLRAALLESVADGKQRWQEVEAEEPIERPRIFQNMFSPGLGGEPVVSPIRYANALADILADGTEFAVPAPIADAIRYLAHADTAAP